MEWLITVSLQCWLTYIDDSRPTLTLIILGLQCGLTYTDNFHRFFLRSHFRHFPPSIARCFIMFRFCYQLLLFDMLSCLVFSIIEHFYLLTELCVDFVETWDTFCFVSVWYFKVLRYRLKPMTTVPTVSVVVVCLWIFCPNRSTVLPNISANTRPRLLKWLTETCTVLHSSLLL